MKKRTHILALRKTKMSKSGWVEITSGEYYCGIHDRVCVAHGKLFSGGEYWEYAPKNSDVSTHRVELPPEKDRNGLDDGATCFKFVPSI